jgi:hypothetical protein
MDGVYGTYGEMRCACRVYMGKPEGKRLLLRSRCRWYVITKWIFKIKDWREQSGLMRQRVKTSGKFLTR